MVEYYVSYLSTPLGEAPQAREGKQLRHPALWIWPESRLGCVLFSFFRLSKNLWEHHTKAFSKDGNVLETKKKSRAACTKTCVC